MLNYFLYESLLLGKLEMFQIPCSNGLYSFFHELAYFSSFVEGWALYAENPLLSHDIDIYKDNLLQKIGMYKWQVSNDCSFPYLLNYEIYVRS